MKILAVDTSAMTASVALMSDGRLVAENSLNHKKTHSEKLMPMIDTALRESEIGVEEIDLFAVSNGPGSFTGLRIGVSTIKALAHAMKKPVVGVSTLEALAYNLFDVRGLVSPIMDARRGQVYNAVYKWEKGKLKEIIAPRAEALENCLSDFEKEQKVYFLGDGVPVHKEKIKKIMGERAEFALPTCLFQRASSVAAIAEIKASCKEVDNYQNVNPIYLRKSQAEREYEEKENKK